MRNGMRLMSTCLAGAGLLATSCVDSGEPGAPPEDQVEQGLTIFSQNPTQGLTGMYAEGDLVLFFETYREPVAGDVGPTHLSFLADGTPVDISVRFSDMEGRNIGVAAAGHALPAHWEVASPQFDPAEIANHQQDRSKTFALVKTAAAAVALAEVDPSVTAEKDQIALVGESAPLEVPEHTPPAMPETVDQTYCPNGCAGWNGWVYAYYEIHYENIGWSAEHSASMWFNCYGNVGCDGWHQTSNHGNWAGNMAAKCGNVSPWRWDWHPTPEGVGSCDWFSGYDECNTGWGDGHNCHDDTKWQKNIIICGQWDVGGTCTGWGCDMNAPSYCGC